MMMVAVMVAMPVVAAPLLLESVGQRSENTVL